MILIKCFIFAVSVMLYLYFAKATENYLKPNESTPGISKIMGLLFPLSWSLILYYWIKHRITDHRGDR